MKHKFEKGNVVEYQGYVFEISKIENRGDVLHYGYFVDGRIINGIVISARKFSSGWIPVILLDEVGKLIKQQFNS